MLIRDEYSGEVKYAPPYKTNKIYTIKLDIVSYRRLEWYDMRGWDWRIYWWLVRHKKIPNEKGGKI